MRLEGGRGIVEKTTGPAAENLWFMPSMEEKKKSILVVDDNKDVTTLMSILLRRLGHEAYCAYDGRGGLSAFYAHSPEIVILDIGLPDMNGYEVAKAIRRDSKNSRKPPTLIALTGYGQKKDEVLSEEAGFNYHLTKPVSVTVLERIINLT